MNSKKLLNYLNYKLNYAANSYSHNLMYHCLGLVDMAFMCGQISRDDYLDLSSHICRDYLNNSEWFKEYAANFLKKEKACFPACENQVSEDC